MTSVARRLGPRRRRQEGAVTVEFALVLLPLLLIVFGIIQYGIYFFSLQSGTSVTREALRKVSVGDCQDAGQLEDYIESRLVGASTGNLSVTRTYLDQDGNTSSGPVVGGVATIEVAYDSLNLNLPFLPFLDDPRIVRTADARTEDDVEHSACS